MKISVIGSGAIGALVAGYLAEAGADITLVARPRDAAVITANGLVIEGVRGQKIVPISAVEEAPAGAELIILAVKTQDITAALAQNRKALSGVPVLSVQNGLRADELIRETVPEELIISSIVVFGATYLEPGRITHNFEGDWIIGKFFTQNDSIVTEISDILRKAFSIYITDGIGGMKWLKLFLNLNNCLPALIGESMQATFPKLQMSQIAIRLWKEALRVVDAAGIKLVSLPDFPEESLRGLAGMEIGEASLIYANIMSGLSTEPLYGSILQSLKRGRPSEIDYLNGEIVRLGERTDTPVPLNKRVVEMVRHVEKTGKFLSPEAVAEEFGRIV